MRGGGTVAERTRIEEQRRKLQARVNSFQSASEAFYSISLGNQSESFPDRNEEDPFQTTDTDDEEGCMSRPEDARLKLPSNIIPGMDNPSPEIRKLAKQELKLREGQANDALRGLRVQLGYKALLFLKEIRKASGYDKRTRAWDDVNKSQNKVDEWVAIYKLARTSMIRLGASQALKEKYEEIKKDDLEIPKDIVDPNRTHQRSDKMSWIWRTTGQTLSGKEAQDWMKECEWITTPFNITN